MNQATDTIATGLNRRGFMIGAAGLSLTVIPTLNACSTMQGAAPLSGQGATLPSQAQKLNAYVSIGKDGYVYILSPATEMGQGSLTALPLIVAEEMDADWDKVVIVPAPASDALYGNPGFGGLQYTAGSMAVQGYYLPLRRFGAQVRQVLLSNAARRWNVPPAQLKTEPGYVVHSDGRRLSYGQIAEFMELPAAAPEIKPEQLKDPATFRLLGKRDVGRIDVPSKVNGSAQYSMDVQLPGMLYGVVTRSPVEGARPLRVDDRAARGMSGVREVVLLPNGVGVIADKPWTAQAARESLKIEWDKSARGWGFNSEEKIAEFSRDVHNLSKPGKPWGAAGDALGAMQKAATVVQREYRCDYAYHAQMEPLNVVASVAADGKSCEVWAGTQSQTMALTAAAQALNIPEDKIKLNVMLMGGGFGRRGNRDEEFVVDGVLLSNAVKAPVKCIWGREDDVKNGRFRPMSAHLLRAGVSNTRDIVAWQHRMASDNVMPFMDPIRYRQFRNTDVLAIVGTELRTYDVANRIAEHLPQDTGIRTSPLRGIGVGPNTFAMECFVDELAAELKEDPLELRMRLLHNAPRAQQVLRDVAQRAGYGKPRTTTGLGLAYLNYNGTELGVAAEISVVEDGSIKVHDIWATIDCGLPVQPENVVAQSTSSVVYGLGLALYERITIKDGAVEQSNFYDYQIPRMRDIPEIHCNVIATPNAPTGVGQMTTPLVAPAIASAFFNLTKRRLRHIPFTRDRVLEALRAPAQTA
ncbi:MAG: Isoquinoline 1-oxidoreductase [Ramlibacter sp.]|nr:Isoquinoline 1-oxidoreductase [Ramlibacter sp.]